jgi:hypothetical protein
VEAKGHGDGLAGEQSERIVCIIGFQRGAVYPKAFHCIVGVGPWRREDSHHLVDPVARVNVLYERARAKDAQALHAGDRVAHSEVLGVSRVVGERELHAESGQI